MNIGPEEHRLACHSVSIAGLAPAERARIEEIGFTAWLDGSSAPCPAETRQHRTWRICAVCDGKFLAQRADAVYCSDRCKMRGSRRRLKHRGQSVTISEKAALQVTA